VEQTSREFKPEEAESVRKAILELVVELDRDKKRKTVASGSILG
jgi:hypothetical protein